MTPPWAARFLLTVVAGDCEAEFIAGDLQEEFAHICARRGPRASRRWYRWQVVRSIAPLLQLRVRKGELTDVLLGAFLAVAAPLILLDRLWQFVYSQIPLKDGLNRASGLLSANVICLLVCAAIAGARARTANRAALGAVAAAAFAALALWSAPENTPAAYILGVMVVAPASSIATFIWRKTR